MDVSWELNDVDILGRVNEMQRSESNFMIGITSDPDERVEKLEEGGEDYDTMQVMYQTRSKSEVRRLLREFSALHDGYTDGYRSRNQGPPFYLYALSYSD